MPVINGTAGDDLIDFEGIGQLISNGGAGNDTIDGAGFSDLLHGGDDNDRIFGQDGNDQVFGDAGNDYVNGGNGNDTVVGGAGEDTLFGGRGSDLLVTDEDDLLVFKGSLVGVVEEADGDLLITTRTQVSPGIFVTETDVVRGADVGTEFDFNGTTMTYDDVVDF